MSSLISIITPLYNTGHLVSETIESVLKQSYLNWELIIVDDCSQDNSAEIVKKYIQNDNRIKLFEFTENKGCATARNYAIKIAKGEFIAFLDSDDLWHEDKLSVQIDYMSRNSVFATHTSYIKFYNTNKRPKTIGAIRKIDYNRMLCGNPIGCLTFVYNQSVLGKFYFDKDYLISEDYAAWIDISRRCEIVGIDKVLAFYRVHHGGKSSKKYKPAIDTWNILYVKENLGLFKTIYYFSKYLLNYVKKECSITFPPDSQPSIKSSLPLLIPTINSSF